MSIPSSATITTPITVDLVRGALELEQAPRGVLPHRLPAWARAQAADPQLDMAESQPSGVRLAFRTRASVLELDTIPTKREYAGAPPRPDGTYDLVVDGELIAQASVAGGDVLSIDMATGSFEHHVGEAGTLRFDWGSEELPGEDRLVEIWLPHDESTVLVELRSDAPVFTAPATAPVWVHHGSSISHGSNASSPTGIWPVVAARRAGVELVNLGFGGSALLDPFVARTIRDIDADVISLKLGINVVNQDVMRLRAFRTAVHGYLDTIREGHPDVPLLIISPTLSPIHEETPGPSVPDMSALAQGRMSFVAGGDPADVATGKLTLAVIRSELARIVAERSTADPQLHYVDGRELYGEADAADLPLPDALHPDPATHRLIGERFADLALSRVATEVTR